MDKKIGIVDINKALRKAFMKSYPKNIKIAIYVREDLNCIEQKYKSLRVKYANFDIYDFYIDDASIEDYTAFHQMLADAEKNLFQVIVMRDYFVFENTDVMVETIQNLYSLKHPVGIYFEKAGTLSFDLPHCYIQHIQYGFEKKLKERFDFLENDIPDRPLPPIIEDYKKKYPSEFGATLFEKKPVLRTAIYLYLKNKKSLEYYKEFITKWNTIIDEREYLMCAGTYVDVASTKDEPVFQKMIDKCKKGEIDYIVTKNIWTLRDDTVKSLGCAQGLMELPSPVGIFYETQGFDTLMERKDARK